MECVEAALKTSIRKEMGFKSFPAQQAALLEDLWAQNGASCEDFSVDELFDFSNQDQVAEEEQLEVEEEEEGKKEKNVNSLSNDHFDPPPASELCVPADDVASLEWLSHFVEDSNSEYATPFPTGILFPKEEGVRSEPGKNSEPVFKTPVPAKARSKRTRTGVRVWPSSESSSSNSSTSTSSSPNQPTGAVWLVPFEPAKKRKNAKKKMERTGEENGSGAQQGGGRRCSHCGVQKTPQWRAGPMGAKTLCNACGVRFKSGRLLPEYRPACSPTFSSELHSNHHRKVLEMRRKKEMLHGGPTGSNPTQVGVPSF